MVMGQITLYIATIWPYVAVLVYNRLTENILPSQKSAARSAIELFALGFSANFCLYLFNAVSLKKKKRINYLNYLFRFLFLSTH
jgi:hypothetical protein